MTLKGPTHLSRVKARPGASQSKTLLRHEVWWKDVVEGEDQLRQRVAFALSQIFVISDTGYTLGNSQYGITSYYDLLREYAFGQYRALLEQVTLSPVMGIYLSMLQNGKGDMAGNRRADENFAREVLQLFSIGLHELKADGTPKLSGGVPIPSFTQAHVEDYARVFTGWNYKGTDRWNRALFTNNDRRNSYLDLSEERALANDADALLDRLDLLMLSGGMSEGLRSILRRHIESLGVTEAALSTRVRDTISLILSSPVYLVQQ